MSDELDDLSAEVAKLLREAGSSLSEAKRIFDEETTAEHREQWPNVYRLESATQHAQVALAQADPRITRKDAAEAFRSAANQARDIIREAVTTGGGSLIDAANGLLNATAQIETRLPPTEEEANAALARLGDFQAEIDKTSARVDQLLSEQDSKFTEAQEKRAARLRTASAKQKAT